MRTLVRCLTAGILFLALAPAVRAQDPVKLNVNFFKTGTTTTANSRMESSDPVEKNFDARIWVGQAQSVSVPFKICFTGTANPPYDKDNFDYTIANDDRALGLDANGCARGDIEANSKNWIYNINIRNDDFDEVTEHIIATISEHPNAPLPAGVEISSTQSSATMSIRDNTPTPITMTRGGALGAVDENSGTTRVEIELGRSLAGNQTVTAPITVTGADEGTHYTFSVSGAFVNLDTDPPHSRQNPALDFWSKSDTKATIRITAQPNTDTEHRLIGVDWGTGSRAPSSQNLPGGIAPVAGGVDIPIANDDGLPSVNISPGAAASEGGSATFTISTTPNANPAPDAMLNVGLTVSEEGGYVGSSSLGSKEISFASGVSSRTYSVSTLTDNTDEPDGSVSVTVQSVAAGERFRYLVGTATATVAVADADATTVTLSAPTGDIDEGSSKTLTVSLNRALVSGESLTAALSFGGGAGFGTDYTLSAPSTLPTGVGWSNLTSADHATSPPTVTFTGGPGAASTATVTLAASTDTNDETDESLTVALGTVSAGAGLSGGASAAPGSLSFDVLDATEPEISIAGESFVTEGTDARFTLTADLASSKDITVNLRVTEVGKYVNNSDEGAKQVTLAAGKTTATWDVPTIADAIDEPRGSITAAVKPGSGYAIKSGAGSASVETRDNDPTTVTLSLTGDWVLERTGTYVDLVLTLGRDLHKGEELAVPLSLTHTTGTPRYYLALQNTTLNDSFDSSTNTVTFRYSVYHEDDDQSATLRLTALYDGTHKAQDKVLTASIPASSASGAPRLGVTILDGGATGSRTGDGAIRFLDPRIKQTVSIAGGDAVTEGTAASFTVNLNGAVSRKDFQAKVRLEQQGDFAAASSLAQRNIVFRARDPVSKTFTVATIGDEDDEAHGHIKATVVPDGSYAVAPAPDNEATVTVNDNDDPPPATPVTTFSAETADVAETAGTATANIALSLAAPKALTLNYALSGTATPGADYAISGVTGTSGTVSVAKDGASASIPLAITDDATAEGDETIIITLTDGDGYSVGTPGNTTLTLVDDEPVVSIAGPSPTAVEGTDLEFTVRSRAPVKTDLTVDLVVEQEGDFVAAEDLGDQQVIIKTGDQSAILTCPTINDQIDEEAGLVTVAIKSGSAYAIAESPADSAKVAITDNDNPTPVISISGGAAVAEGDDASFTITALPAPAANLTVKLAITQTGDFAAQGAVGDKTVVVGTSGSATWTVATSEDETDEKNGTITATLNDGEGYAVADPPNNAASVTVNDNDEPIPVVSISGGAAVAEGIDASFTVTATPAPAADLTVKLTIAQTGDFAAQGAAGDKTVVIGASGTATYNVTTMDDETDEPNGRITATLNAGEGYTVADAPGNAALVAINDNDEPLPVVSVSGGAAAPEGDAAEFTVTATPAPAPAADLTVKLTVAQTGDFAAQGAAGDKTVVIDASGSASYAVATMDDNAVESNGSITVTLADGEGYTVAAPPGNAASVAVNDNDTQTGTPEITLSASPNPVGEGGSVTVTASISRAMPNAVTVPLVLTAGSAETNDYGTLASIQIPANQTSGAGAITTGQDNDTEDETFTVALGTLPGSVAAGTPSSVSLRIADDDTPVVLPEVTLSAFPNPVDEGGSVTVTASLSQSLGGSVVIPLVLTTGTAETDDYGAMASIEIPGGQTSGTGAIATVQDDDTEDETFTVALGSLPVGVTTGTPSLVNLRITDNTDVTSSIESLGDEIPAAFALEQNYPNPFNPSTTIEFALDKTQRVTLSVYDMLGQEVQVLMDGVQPAARYRIAFDAADLASGTYLYVLRAEEQVAVKTMALLK